MLTMNITGHFRRLLSALLFLWVALPAFAQMDTIFLRNGHKIVCVVNEVFYQRVSYSVMQGDKVMGPEYFDHQEINRIIFSNGNVRYFNVPGRERESLGRVIQRDEQDKIFLEGFGRLHPREGVTPYVFLKEYFKEKHGPMNAELLRDDQATGIVAGKARSRTSYRVPGVSAAQDLDVFFVYQIEFRISESGYRFKVSDILLFLPRSRGRPVTIEALLSGYNESVYLRPFQREIYDELRERVFFHTVSLPFQIRRRTGTGSRTTGSPSGGGVSKDFSRGSALRDSTQGLDPERSRHHVCSLRGMPICVAVCCHSDTDDVTSSMMRFISLAPRRNSAPTLFASSMS